MLVIRERAGDYRETPVQRVPHLLTSVKIRIR